MAVEIQCPHWFYFEAKHFELRFENEELLGAKGISLHGENGSALAGAEVSIFFAIMSQLCLYVKNLKRIFRLFFALVSFAFAWASLFFRH